MLEYTLEDNELTDKQGDLRTQVINVTSYTQNDIVDRIMNISAGLTRSVIEAENRSVEQVRDFPLFMGGPGGDSPWDRRSLSGGVTGVEPP
jgi:hypothetical protein